MERGSLGQAPDTTAGRPMLLGSSILGHRVGGGGDRGQAWEMPGEAKAFKQDASPEWPLDPLVRHLCAFVWMVLPPLGHVISMNIHG